MNVENGRIMDADSTAFNAMPRHEQQKYIPVTRSLTVKERSDMQIRLYSPCGCGSGKKFKFCCKKP